MIPKPYTINRIFLIPKIIWDKKIYKQNEFTYIPWDFNEPLLIHRKRAIYIPKIITKRKLCLSKPIQLHIPESCENTFPLSYSPFIYNRNNFSSYLNRFNYNNYYYPFPSTIIPHHANYIPYLDKTQIMADIPEYSTRMRSDSYLI